MTQKWGMAHPFPATIQMMDTVIPVDSENEIISVDSAWCEALKKGATMWVHLKEKTISEFMDGLKHKEHKTLKDMETFHMEVLEGKHGSTPVNTRP